MHQSQRKVNDLAGENRCSWCNRMYASSGYLVEHRKRVGKRACSMKPKIRSYVGTQVDKMVQNKKREELLKNVSKCQLEGADLKYKIKVEYLGTMWQGDGGCDVDVDRRTTMARQTYNQLWFFWSDAKFSRSLKMQIFEANVLSRVVWGAEGWLLTESIQAKLNGWCSRCLAPITGQTPHAEASERKQSMSVVGIIRYRRLVYVGHVLRDDPGSLTRKWLLRYAELERRGVINEPGDILMDVPASTANGDLVDMAGGFGTAEHREKQRLHWRGLCKRRLADVDRTRQVMKEDLLAEIRKSVTANTAEETAAALLNTAHSWRIYSDEGCDGNGAKGIWGKAGYGAVIYACGTDGTVTEVADLYGPVVTDVQSEWFMGAVKGTKQTGELCGVIQALLWLLEHAFEPAMPQPESDQDGAGSPLKRMDARRKGEGGLEDEGNAVGDADEEARVLDEARAAYDARMAAINERGVVICVDSLYAGNQLEGYWRVNCNKALIEVGQDLLRRVRLQREVTFVHVKGHSTDGGNDRADKLVQWGKSEGPFSRMQIGGGEEGAGCVRAVIDGPVSATEQPGEAETQDEGSDGGAEQQGDEQADLLADFDRAFDEARDDMRMRDSIDSIGSVLREIYGTSSEEDEEEEIVAAQTQIDSVAEQIALGDAGDRTEMMNDIRQLGQVTATLSSLRIVEDHVVKICERMGRCWISTIGYRIKQIPTEFVVCDSYRSFTITVQAGSRGPIANK